MDKNQQHIARLLETTTAKTSPERRTAGLCFGWKRRLPPQHVVCLHVHRIRGLPPAANGQFVAVGWRTSGSKGEKTTLPAEVSQGSACFDEVFLHYCSGVEEVRSALKGIVVSVSSIDDCSNQLSGSFRIDLSEVVLAENLNLKNGGKMVSLDLEGIADSGVLSVGVYCRILEEEEEEADNNNNRSCLKNDASKKQSKSKCFSCIPDLKGLRIRQPQTVHVRRVPSARPQPVSSITIEDSITKQCEDDGGEGEGEGFITIEKGAFQATPRHPPSDDLRNSDDDDGEEEFEDDLEDGRHGTVGQFDMDRVEAEFLRMLEAKHWKKAAKREDMKGKGVLDHCLSLDLGLDLDLDGLIKEAEMELNRAAHVLRRSRGGGAVMEKEDYEELMKRLGSANESSFGFGSPF